MSRLGRLGPLTPVAVALALAVSFLGSCTDHEPEDVVEAVGSETITIRTVDGLTLDVPTGGGVVITGADGAGTSAVIRALAGLLVPFSGLVEVLGSPAHDPALRPRVGYCPERRPFVRHLRVREVGVIVARVRGLGTAAAAPALRASGLDPDDARRVGGLELGDVRRLALACALVGDPDVLVLDDPWEYPETVEALGAARARGATVVLATPDPGGFPGLVGPLVTLPGGGDEQEGRP